MGQLSRYWLLIATASLYVSMAVSEDIQSQIGIQQQQIYTQDCQSYQWKPFSQLTSIDKLEYAGYDSRVRQHLFICRLQVNNELVVGKVSVEQKSCWVPYKGSEIGSLGSQDFEVLTNPASIQPNWVATSKGAILPVGSFPGGHDESHTTYVARCRWVSDWGNEVTPGSLHREFYGITVLAMFVPYGGGAPECDNIEIMTCT